MDPGGYFRLGSWHQWLGTRCGHFWLPLPVRNSVIHWSSSFKPSVLFPDEKTTSLCCWDSRNAERNKLLSLGECLTYNSTLILWPFLSLLASLVHRCLCLQSGHQFWPKRIEEAIGTFHYMYNLDAKSFYVKIECNPLTAYDAHVCHVS